MRRGCSGSQQRRHDLCHIFPGLRMLFLDGMCNAAGCCARMVAHLRLNSPSGSGWLGDCSERRGSRTAKACGVCGSIVWWSTLSLERVKARFRRVDWWSLSTGIQKVTAAERIRSSSIPGHEISFLHHLGKHLTGPTCNIHPAIGSSP